MNITSTGTGYVGLVTGACLADRGNDVFCLDVDQGKIDLLNSGGVPIYEPGLKKMINADYTSAKHDAQVNTAWSKAYDYHE